MAHKSSIPPLAPWTNELWERGAQVGEISLLTRVGLIAAQAADSALMAQEGAFGTQLLIEDIIDEPLMFGTGGTLAFTSSGPGWGFTPSPKNHRLGT